MGQGFILPALFMFDLLYSKKKNNLKKEWIRERVKKGGIVQIQVLQVYSICLREALWRVLFFYLLFSHIF